MFVPDEFTTNLLRNNEPQPIPPQNLRVKTWFMQRNNEILAVDESSAWHMMHRNRPPVKIVGVSYADNYASAVENIKNIAPEQRKQYLKDAFDKEVEAARGHIEYPRNPNIRNERGDIQTDPNILSQLK